MYLADKDLEEFIAIHREEFQEELTIPEAREMASRLLFLYEQLLKPLPSELAEAEEVMDEPPEDSPVDGEDLPSPFPQDA
jgi:hypothetical protein